MGIIAVKAWKASDGTLWADEIGALEHERATEISRIANAAKNLVGLGVVGFENLARNEVCPDIGKAFDTIAEARRARRSP